MAIDRNAMELGYLTQVIEPDALYRCNSMPAGRALWTRWEGGNFYVRPDGSLDPFEFALEERKYYGDSTWRKIGYMPRLAPDGRLDLAKLAEVLEG